MTDTRNVDDLLDRMNALIDQHDRRAWIDRQLATERDSARRAALRMLRRFEEEDL